LQQLQTFLVLSVTLARPLGGQGAVSRGLLTLRNILFTIIFPLAGACALVLVGCQSGSPDSSTNFSSGGLGLGRGQWERVHGKALSQDSAYVVYRTSDQGVFSLNFGHSNCFSLRRSYGSASVPLDAARNESRDLIPTDSSLTRTYSSLTNSSTVVDLYHSESLKTRFSDDPNNWREGEPGDFTVAYYKWENDDKVDEFVIRTGNNP